VYTLGELEQQVELERATGDAKFSGRVRLTILIVGSIASWVLVLAPIWLLTRG